MAVLTAPDEPKALATDSPGATVLRVSRRGEEPVRTVPLTAGKCTVGSSPQCQVCLPSPEVRPLQCLITLKSNVATVTRWAAGVKLNGQEFSKAELTDGDRLTIGDWALEIEHGEPVPEEDSAAFDDEALSIETTLDSLQEQTLDEASEWDEPQVAAVESLQETVTAPIFDWPIAYEATPIVDEGAPVVVDEWPIIDEATPVEATPAAPANCLSSHAFADSLVLQLWTANDRARRRAKMLITGLRAARFQADALAADLSAIETELDLARAAYDSHLGNDERLQQELAKQHEERVTPLLEEIASLQSELEQAQADISRQTAAYETLTGELAALQVTAKTPTVDPALATRAEELEAAVAAQSQELEQLASELCLAQQEQERLAELHQLEATRSAQFARALLEQQALIEAAAAENLALEEPIAISDPAPVVDERWRHATPTVEEPAQTPTPAKTAFQSPEPSTPAPATEPTTAEYSSTSFIDKYRHLLESDEAPTIAPKGARPIIDDEFLSPAKAETGLGPADESDEALEAYMANMMRRMRSTSPSYESSQSAAALDDSLLHGADSKKASGTPAYSIEATSSAEFVPEEPFNFEDMKNATRKTPLASDLAALREIANNSARTAIATHNQKQVRESAVTKVAIALTAAAASAYIMASAPAFDAWQFWGGAVTGVLGIGAAVQALLIERRSRVRVG
jgi:hypothetical protein